MADQKIGVEALFKDADFKKGVSNYDKSLKEAAKATDNFTKGVTASSKAQDEAWKKATEAAEKSLQAQKKAQQELTQAYQTTGKTAGVFGAILTAAATKAVMTAGRTEELGIVLHRVGLNAGYSADQMDAFDKSVQGMGITTQSSRQSIIQMIQAQLDLSHATELARLAQDAAVIAQLDSSEAFNYLITTIQRGSLLMARQLGLVVSWEDAYDRMAETLGKTASELTQQEKLTARTNEVLRAGANIAGTYDAAMESAAKQMRSMNRHVQELTNELGSALLPVLGGIVEALTNTLKWFRALPPEVQSTVAIMGGLTGVLGTAAGAITVLGPKVMSLVAALQALGGLSFVGPVGLIAGLATAVVYVAQLEQAHEQEAAAILESSKNYFDYTARLHGAGLEAYKLSEGLYEIAKSGKEAEGAFTALELQKARGDVEQLTDEIFAEAQSMEVWSMEANASEEAARLFDMKMVDLVEHMSDAELVVAANRREMYDLGLRLKMTEEQAAAFADRMVELASAQQDTNFRTEMLRKTTEGFRNATHESWVEIDKAKNRIKEEGQAIEDTTDQINDLAEKTGLSVEMVRALSNALADQGYSAGDASQAILDYAKALDTARQMQEDFIGALADGIVALGDLDDAAVQSSQDYQDALDELDQKAKHVYDGLKTKVEESLPDPTSVRERLEMTGDAWDEWGLRLNAIMDGVTTEQEQGWVDFLMQMTQGTDLAFDASTESVQDWAARLKEAFYAGDLPSLINEDTAAWQENAKATAAAQAEQTAAVQQETDKQLQILADKRAKLDAEREQRLAAEQAARDEAMLQITLSMAESSGLLQQWAQNTFGPDFAGAFDTAAEVIAALQAGIINLDGPLQDMVATLAGGVNQVYDDTRTGAEGLQNDLRTTFQGVADEAQRNADELTTVLDLEQYLTAEDAKAAGEAVGTSFGEGVEENIPEDPTAKLVAAFETAQQAIAETSGLIATSIDGIPDVQETEIRTKGADTTLDKLEEIRLALEGLHAISDVNINVNAEYNAPDALQPESPTLQLQHALENLSDAAREMFPLDVELVTPGQVQIFADYANALQSMFEVLNTLRSYAGGLAGFDQFTSDTIQLLNFLSNLRIRPLGGAEGGPTLMDFFESVLTVAEGMAAIAQHQALDVASIQTFMDDLSLVIGLFLDLLDDQTLGLMGLPGAVYLAENVAAVVAPLQDMVSALNSLATYTGADSAQIVRLVDDLSFLIDTLATLEGTHTEQVLAAAIRIGALVGLIGKATGEAAEGLSLLAQYEGVSEGALSLFAVDLPRVLDLFLGLTETYGIEDLQAGADKLAEAASIVGDAAKAALDMASFAEYEPLSPAGFEQFRDDFAFVVQHLLLVADDLEEQGVPAAADLLGAAAGIVSDVGRAVQGMASLSEYTGFDDVALVLFEQDFQKVLDAMLRLAADYQDLGDEAAAELVTDTTSIVAAAGDAVRGLLSLADYTGFAEESLALFERDFPRVLEAMLNTLAQFMAEGVGESADLADDAAGIVGNISRAIEGLVALSSYMGVSQGTIIRFTDDFSSLLDRLLVSLDTIDPGDVARLESFGAVLSAIGGGVSAGFQALVDVASYRGGVTLGLDNFMSDLSLLANAYLQLESNLPAGGENVGELLSSIGRGVEAAFNAMVSIASYRGGIGAGLAAFISDIQLLITTLQDLGESMPTWMLPGSLPPLAKGLQAINREMRGVASATGSMVQRSSTLNLSMGPVNIANGMDQAAFEARTVRVIKRSFRGLN